MFPFITTLTVVDVQIFSRFISRKLSVYSIMMPQKKEELAKWGLTSNGIVIVIYNYQANACVLKIIHAI